MPLSVMCNWLTFFTLLILHSPLAEARSLIQPNANVRALGMGNAFVALAKDTDALFYNPAGLGRTTHLTWTIMDLRLGASGYEAFQNLQDAQGSGSFADTVASLYGESVGLGVGLKTGVTMPYLGFAVFNDFDARLLPENPAFPTLNIDAMNDYGAVAGIAIPLLPNLHWGTSLRRVKRTGSSVPFGPSFVASLDPEVIMDSVMNEGRGYGLDTGFNLILPNPLVTTTLSLLWRDIGKTSYRPQPGLTPPPRQEDEILFGLGAQIDLPMMSITPALDLRFLNDTKMQLNKKLNFGVEVSLPLLDARAGFHQGYYALGAGLDIGIMRLDLATYGVEVGEYAGQLEDRRYLLQLTLELGFDVKSTLFTINDPDPPAPSARGRRIKQRR